MIISLSRSSLPFLADTHRVPTSANASTLSAWKQYVQNTTARFQLLHNLYKQLPQKKIIRKKERTEKWRVISKHIGWPQSLPQAYFCGRLISEQNYRHTELCTSWHLAPEFELYAAWYATIRPCQTGDERKKKASYCKHCQHKYPRTNREKQKRPPRKHRGRHKKG